MCVRVRPRIRACVGKVPVPSADDDDNGPDTGEVVAGNGEGLRDGVRNEFLDDGRLLALFVT